jgi:hypothetical protein
LQERKAWFTYFLHAASLGKWAEKTALFHLFRLEQSPFAVHFSLEGANRELALNLKRKTLTQTSLGNAGIAVTPIAAIKKLQQALNEFVRESHVLNTGGGYQKTAGGMSGQRRRGRPPQNVQIT